jgi:hypothetical protein
MLHITNGDAAANVLRRAGIAEPILAWRDVLHEGPVPGGLSLRELSKVRAAFIIECGWGRPEEIARQFDARDTTVESTGSDAQVLLWFESDLYDQLQLCQVLAWYRDQSARPRLSLISSADSKEGAFRGLGSMQPAAIADLAERARPVERNQLELAARVWDAFRSPEPLALDKVRRGGTQSLPELGAALERLLQELPAKANGLSRTEQAALSAVAEGARAPAEIFVAVHTREQRPFMGDWPFWRLLAHLASGTTALLELASGARPRFPPQVPAAAAFGAQRFRLTPAGREVLERRRDAIHTIGIDRWWGGTHLKSNGTVWRWDETSETLSRA